VSVEGWEDFQKDWQEPILRQSIAQDEWARLTPEQRTMARQAARGYVIWRKEHKKPPNVISAHLFLREKDAWQGFAAKAPDAPKISPNGFDAASPEGRAIKALYAVARISPFESRGRIVYPGEVTPQLLAFADHDRPSAWHWIEDRKQIGAWSRFVPRSTSKAAAPPSSQPGASGRLSVTASTRRGRGRRARTARGRPTIESELSPCGLIWNQNHGCPA
jgi:hypothetical protein